MTPNTELGGEVLAALPWTIAAIGGGSHTHGCVADRATRQGPPFVSPRGASRWRATSSGHPGAVAHMTPYASTTCDVGNEATLIAFTDGLFERGGELIDWVCSA